MPRFSRRLLLTATMAALAWIVPRAVAKAASLGTGIRGVDHIGLVVRDIAAATAFLEAAIGARVIYDTLPLGADPQEGHDAESRLGLASGARIVAIRMMHLANGPGIELFQVEADDQHGPARSSDLGWQHIALYTDDIDAALVRFAQAGGTVLSRPHSLPPQEAGPGNQFCYAQMPFGPLIEFITYPHPQPYREQTDLRRWTPPAS